ncbi:MAG: methylmalonyl Co-A mutase-associated GTPase MeaB [Bacteriovoracaceae bacterium]|jgi:LAO/AO transport system kinase|nr:methylmalonyl Co-A mutase-associated GTPase MeaB [Bacteriovoracaceae bacterium]
MKKNLSLADYISGIKNKDLSILARAITLVESMNVQHRQLANELIKNILPLTGKARRVGISGTPGVGKSTFLENFGLDLINQNNSLAILAIDPTSQLTGGSILGDKTRMAKLSAHRNAFIRPSPNGKTLGGVAAKTREAMLLCDAFGFDYIFIETVGVGQSEISVSKVVDMFILLMQPGGGDELQGIKRGILEVSDLVIINKADGEHASLAKIAQHDYKKSLEVLQENRQWQTKVLRCSSLKKEGFKDIKKSIDTYFDQYDKSKRQAQFKSWIEDLLVEKFSYQLAKVSNFDEKVNAILAGKNDLLTSVDDIYKEVISYD